MISERTKDGRWPCRSTDSAGTASQCARGETFRRGSFIPDRAFYSLSDLSTGVRRGFHMQPKSKKKPGTPESGKNDSQLTAYQLACLAIRLSLTEAQGENRGKILRKAKALWDDAESVICTGMSIEEAEEEKTLGHLKAEAAKWDKYYLPIPERKEGDQDSLSLKDVLDLLAKEAHKDMRIKTESTLIKRLREIYSSMYSEVSPVTITKYQYKVLLHIMKIDIQRREKAARRNRKATKSPKSSGV